MRRTLTTIATLAIAGSVGAVALAQSNPPPPSGGFDTTVCHGRGAHPPANGRLIGHSKRLLALYSLRPDGTGLRRETHPPALFGDLYPAPSPDGRSIAFLRVYFPNQDDRPLRLMVVNLRTHKTHFVASGAFQTYAPAWSADGRWITAGTVQKLNPTSHTQVRTASVVHPDGTGLKLLDAGGWLLLNGSWSPNGRCFAALARFQDQGPTASYEGDGGLAVLPGDGGRPNTLFPNVPCPASGWAACAPTVPAYGANQPNYVGWTRDGRALITLRALARKPPKTEDDTPDEVDIARSGLAESARAKVILRKALFPHMSPDGRFIAAFSTRSHSFGVYRVNGRLVVHTPKFSIDAWLPARRR